MDANNARWSLHFNAVYDRSAFRRALEPLGEPWTRRVLDAIECSNDDGETITDFHFDIDNIDDLRIIMGAVGTMRCDHGVYLTMGADKGSLHCSAQLASENIQTWTHLFIRPTAGGNPLKDAIDELKAAADRLVDEAKAAGVKG